MKVGIVGCYHQGLVAAACNALKNNTVYIYDSDLNLRNNLKDKKLPIFEPGLDKIYKKYYNNKKIIVCDSLLEIFKKVDIIFLAHDIPINNRDESDLKIFHNDLNQIIKFNHDKEKFLVISAQIPANTCNEIEKKIKLLKNKIKIAYIPENLKLGEAIERYLNPPLPVIGANSKLIFNKAKKIMKIFSNDWHMIDLAGAEMIKHLLNSFLALRIAYINELNLLSKKLNINFDNISKLINLEPRLSGLKNINPGLAFSGGTLARDLKTLKKISRNFKLDLKLINSIYSSNFNHSNLLIKKIKNIIFINKIKSVGIIGLSYKPDSDTLRRSFSIELIKKLKLINNLNVYDINYRNKTNKKIHNAKIFNNFTSFYNSSKLIILMNNKKTYLNLIKKNIKNDKTKKFIFDTSREINAKVKKNIKIIRI